MSHHSDHRQSTARSHRQTTHSFTHHAELHSRDPDLEADARDLPMPPVQSIHDLSQLPRRGLYQEVHGMSTTEITKYTDPLSCAGCSPPRYQCSSIPLVELVCVAVIVRHTTFKLHHVDPRILSGEQNRNVLFVVKFVQMWQYLIRGFIDR